MFEDMVENLAVPSLQGMTTVMVQSENPDIRAVCGEPAEYVHHITNDLTDFLQDMITKQGWNNGPQGKG